MRSRVRNRMGLSHGPPSVPSPATQGVDVAFTRLAAVGPASQTLLAGAGRHIGPGGTLEQPDFLFVDPESGARALIDEAHGQGVPVIAVGSEGELEGADLLYDGIGPLVPGGEAPLGFRWNASREPAALVSDRPGDLHSASSWAQHLGGHVGDVGSRMTADISEFQALLDHGGFHRTPGERARAILGAAAVGTPVVAHEPAELAGLLGDDLVREVALVALDEFADPGTRERRSVRQRRAALARGRVRSFTAGINEALGLPGRRYDPVSILVSTRRPEYLESIADALGRQSYPLVQPVVALHGPGFPASTEEMLTDRLADAIVLRVPDGAGFGDALTLATEAADGLLLAKMDDDDWYGVDHILDLVLAHEYSGATLVGKAAEFVYLGALDRTIRRFQGGAETYSTTIAGGTLLFPKQALLDVGGWRRVSRFIDRALIDDLLRSGGSVYRTHGFGYVLNRHGSDHTWIEEDRYFEAQADDGRDGLDLAFAGVG